MRYAAIALVLATACSRSGAVAEQIQPASDPIGTAPCLLTTSLTAPSKRGLDVCRRQVRLYPDSVDLLQAYGAELISAKRARDAIDVWQRLVRVQPQSFPFRFTLGRLLENEGRFSEALIVFRQALPVAATRADSQTAAWHMGLGTSLLGHLKESLVWSLEAAALDSLDASAWNQAAVTAHSLNRHVQAVSYWARALLINPQFFATNPYARDFFQKSLRVVGPQSPAPVVRQTLPEMRTP